MDPRIGTEFAGHRIESVIGRGGASVVYLAEHLRLGRKVALKVLAPHLADDEAFRKRFIRESRIAAGLDHPNVVTVYDAGEIEGNLYISMRYVEGSDLGRLLASGGALEPSRTVLILSQIANALDAAHAQGLVHRDVKPANMLIEAASDLPAFDRAYLSDFGISKRTTSREGLTRTGQFVGTVDYVAPEQITGEPVDGRTDGYSLGCVLFECLSGHVPFPGESGVATIYSHLHDAPPSLKGVGEHGEGMDRVLAKALAKRKEERYETSTGLIEAARSELLAEAPTVTLVRPTPGAGASPSSSEVRPGVGSRRRAWGLTGAATLVVAIVAIVVVELVLAGDGPGSSPRGGSGGTSQQQTGSTGATGPVGAELRLSWSDAYTSLNLGGPGSQAIVDAVTLKDVVVAVGHRPPGAQETGHDDAAVWRSEDGSVWTTTRSDSFHGDEDRRMTVVVEFGDALVAAGSDRSDAAVWVSTDAGETWTPSTSPALTGLGPQRIQDMAPVGTQVIAIGSSGVGDKTDAAAWISSDGLEWARMDPGAFEAPGQQQMWAVQPVGLGLVAVGFTNELGTMDAAAWTYEDDIWTRADVASLEAPGQQVMLDVAGGGELPIVAVGCEDAENRCDTALATEADAAVWISSDAGSWDRVPFGEARLNAAGRQVMRAVVTYHGSFVAAGTQVGPDDLDGAVWTSVDGLTWQYTSPVAPTVAELGGKGDQSLRALVRYGHHGIVLLGFGVSNEGEDENAHVWTAISLSG